MHGEVVERGLPKKSSVTPEIGTPILHKDVFVEFKSFHAAKKGLIV